MSIASLELDLDLFSGPFDLLLTLILREEVDLLELALADVVLAYLDHLEAQGELDLETATEFIVLIAALLELKSRLMLSGEEEDELLDIEPAQAAEELLERMLEARRYRAAAGHLGDEVADEALDAPPASLGVVGELEDVPHPAGELVRQRARHPEDGRDHPDGYLLGIVAGGVGRCGPEEPVDELGAQHAGEGLVALDPPDRAERRESRPGAFEPRRHPRHRRSVDPVDAPDHLGGIF